jgi:hypothetical protein
MRKYLLKETQEDKIKALERSIKISHRVIESAQKKCARAGKDKSLLHQACALGYIVNAHPIIRDGKRYVNPMTFGDKLFLEEIGTYRSVEFKNNEFVDKDGKLVYINGY